MKNSLNQVGSSLIEVMVAIGLLGIVMSSTSYMVLHLKKRAQTVLIKRSGAIQFQNLANSILSDPKLFKVNFDPSEAAMCQTLGATNLPLRWDKSTIYDAVDCGSCQGKLGYVIQPFPLNTMRGVYLVTFRVYHPEETALSTAVCNGVTIPGVRQYQMIVGLKQ